MSVAPNKRSNVTLYVCKADINSQRIRMVVAEKSVPADIIEVDSRQLPAELLSINPFGTLPTLTDRDLILYEPSIISEYLDERFPHPPLLPVYPIARAKSRLMMLRIEKEWYSLVKTILESPSQHEAKEAKNLLTESIISFAPVFSATPYFLGDEFSLLDCCIAPLLWHLPKLGIVLPPQFEGIHQYSKKLFDRPSFRESLSRNEFEDVSA